ncbi:hypothetical protein Vadar_027976 [Vaccinium darrowii]|uniref:Uncharacterized protein n=1 Tax=Vaccinium darrowii TaxID=229202 RepID=A0ACB7Y2A0_9ERIC|nr:hypothetical protein Vadar_027976 [Vaccinium darrowii]
MSSKFFKFWIRVRSLGVDLLITNEKIGQASSFFSQIGEGLCNYERSDLMLNVLLKANQNAKELNRVWEQAVEELMLEKETLITEIER